MKIYRMVMASVAGAFAVFHLLVIAGVVPPTVVWGGRITERGRLVAMESVSLVVILVVGALGYIRGVTLDAAGSAGVAGATAGQIAVGGAAGVALGVVMWVFAGLFVLNSVGNVFAVTRFERLAFTPVTVILAYLSIRLALGR